MVKLQVHEGHCLLHMLDVRGREVEMALAQPQISAQRRDVAAGTEARADQSARM